MALSTTSIIILLLVLCSVGWAFVPTASLPRRRQYALPHYATSTRHSKEGNAGETRETTSTIDRKEGRFVQWMTSDSWKEVPHPGSTLKVEGRIPSYVRGSYLKNGPGAFTMTNHRYTHAFDGLAKLQKFDIKDGNVQFTTRFVQSNVYLSNSRNETTTPMGHVSVGPVEPPFGLWDRLAHTLSYDNACVNVEELSCSGVVVAVTDAAVQQQIDPATLETVGQRSPSQIQGTNGLTEFSTAHSKVARLDNCTYNYYLENGLFENWAHMVRTNADLSRTSIGKVPVGRSKFPYVHEISVTDRYAVLVLYPVLVDMAQMILSGALLPTLEFDTTQTAKICLFDLHETQPVKIFETDPFWSYHHVNAYEEGSKVVLDLIGYDTPAIANGPHGYLYMDNMKTEETRLRQEREGSVWRFTMDLASDARTVAPQKKIVHCPSTGLPYSMELISVSPECLGKPYRYVYGFTGFYQGKPGYMDWAIVKQDVVEDTLSGVWYEDSMYPGEVTFVKDPNGSEEDNGILLSTVYDAVRDENFLLVLDATNMKELARAYTGVGFPQSFHGKFYPASQ